MSMNNYQRRVHSILTERMNLPVDHIDVDLFEDGVLDSLTFVDLLAQLEDEFQVEIAVEELELDALRTIRSIGDLVYNTVNGATRDDPQAT